MVFGNIFEIFVPINYLIVLQIQVIGCFPKDRQFFLKLMTAFSFVSLYSTDIVPNSYSQMHGWGYSTRGGLLTICGSRVGAFSRGANSRIYGILMLELKVAVVNNDKLVKVTYTTVFRSAKLESDPKCHTYEGYL